MGNGRFFFEDECHLTWGDICGYVWGAKTERIKLPIVNERLRRSYFGALNIMTGRVVIKSYDDAKGESVVNFLAHLLRSNPRCKLTVFWDGASVHRCALIRDFLEKINQGKAGLKARILLVRLAPNAPEENPIEDVWLQGKTHIRQTLGYENFSKVQESFKNFVGRKKFAFSKIKKHQQYYK